MFRSAAGMLDICWSILRAFGLLARAANALILLDVFDEPEDVVGAVRLREAC
jgi:hypothetical protein